MPACTKGSPILPSDWQLRHNTKLPLEVDKAPRTGLRHYKCLSTHVFGGWWQGQHGMIGGVGHWDGRPGKGNGASFRQSSRGSLWGSYFRSHKNLKIPIGHRFKSCQTSSEQLSSQPCSIIPVVVLLGCAEVLGQLLRHHLWSGLSRLGCT